MYRDVRPVNESSVTASTPELWAKTFAASTRMNVWKMFRLSATKEWRLIRRYVPRGARVLDAGCGFGEWVAFLKSRGYAAEGLDFSPQLVRRLRATYPDLKWTDGDIRHMPYDSDLFDSIISWGVIEHDEAGPAKALREFWRVLKPGGVAIVTVPVDSEMQRYSAKYLYYRQADGNAFFQYFMTVDELAEHLQSSGFQVIDSAVLPGTVLQAVSPLLAARLHGVPFRTANLVASVFFARVHRYSVMTYCVGQKPFYAVS